ncbi:MAG: tetratricopeptide repeat protein [Treponema sp.]|jgi:tetratricopeptide (TPR) repeat protein|nr:tetratricopeptide repeat protein [Treponema sp.]
MAETLQEGIRLFQLKRWSMAVQVLLQMENRTVKTEEGIERAYYLGLCYTKLGRFDDALLYLEQVVNTAQNSLQVYQCRMTLAYIYALTSRAKMAEFELDRLVASGFESVQLYLILAYTSHSQRQPEKAVQWYEKVLNLDKHNTTAINGLGYILVDTNLDVRRGLRFCQIAVDRNPQNAAYLDSLGWACFKNGNTVEAKNWLRRALELAPQHKDIQNHMKIVVKEAS